MRFNHKQATEENFGKFSEIFVHLIFKGLSRDLVLVKKGVNSLNLFLTLFTSCLF